MTREEFERFRDLGGKRIESDIIFKVKPNHQSWLTSDRLKISNSLGVDAVLHIQYNPKADAKVLTIVLSTESKPICRMCVDNGGHGPCMSSHKHYLKTPECVKNNLGDGVEDRPDWDGLPLDRVFETFCDLLKIQHVGTFTTP